MKQAVIIGSGFSGLSAACFLAKEGLNVTVLEKNDSPGGRARSFVSGGFRFDMGPSWYWMPDVFERFFGQFGHTVSDFYELLRLDPSYRVIWDEGTLDIPAGYTALRSIFEQLETGAGARLDAFMKEAEYKYRTSMRELVYKPGVSLREYLHTDVLKSLLRIDMFTSMERHIRKYFRHPKLIQLASFPILFLGALPKNTPALYSLMNYADIKLGTWYPAGGMEQIVQAMYRLATSLGVQFRFQEPAEEITAKDKQVLSVKTATTHYPADVCVAACDYHYAEQQLLQPEYRNYDTRYWHRRKLSPSSLIFYLGVDKKLKGLQHHNLFFNADFDAHARTLFAENAAWPDAPLMYVCCPSRTDAGVAPQGCENLFVLIPVASGLEDTESTREHYYRIVMERLERRTGHAIASHVVFKRSYAHNDFIADYHSFKGNAYGLANTLDQTAVLKPSIRNKKLSNLFYAGQLTVPGPGVPPALISGEIVAGQIIKSLKQPHRYDTSL